MSRRASYYPMRTSAVASWRKKVEPVLDPSRRREGSTRQLDHNMRPYLHLRVEAGRSFNPASRRPVHLRVRVNLGGHLRLFPGTSALYSRGKMLDTVA